MKLKIIRNQTFVLVIKKINNKIEKFLKKKYQKIKTEKSFSFTVDNVVGEKKLKTFPTQWRPQLAILTDKVFDNDQWVFENKYDGYRVLIQIQKGKVDLVFRNGVSFNAKYKDLMEAFTIFKEVMILDGEIVVEDKKGNSKFHWLQYY